MKINNRDKIFDVSVDLFSKYGYDAVSIRRIAREVGIKESSIYNHYKCKESILDAILEYYISKMTSDEIPLSKAAENLDVGIDFFYILWFCDSVVIFLIHCMMPDFYDILDIFPYYGSDVGAAYRSGRDLKGALIGQGVHASHGMERTHLDGCINTMKLLTLYLLNK